MSLSALVGTDLAPHAWKFLIAFALGLPTGWERYRHDRSAGLRTFPLVSLASCAYMLVAAQQTLGRCFSIAYSGGCDDRDRLYRRRLDYQGGFW